MQRSLESVQESCLIFPLVYLFCFLFFQTRRLQIPLLALLQECLQSLLAPQELLVLPCALLGFQVRLQQSFSLLVSFLFFCPQALPQGLPQALQVPRGPHLAPLLEYQFLLAPLGLLVPQALPRDLQGLPSAPLLASSFSGLLWSSTIRSLTRLRLARPV